MIKIISGSNLVKKFICNYHLQSIPRIRYLSEKLVSENEKLINIADTIGNLSVLELVSLNKIIKEKFNIVDIPVMVQSGVVDNSSQENQPSKAKEDEKKISFSTRIDSFESDKRIQLIKTIRELIPHLNLVEAKKFVDSVPKVTHENITKDEADQIKAKLESVGAKISIL